MKSEIIENIKLKKRRLSAIVFPVVEPVTSQCNKSSVIPDWTELNSAPDVECVHCSVKCITPIDFCMMMGTILIGMMLSLATLYVGILVGPFRNLKSTSQVNLHLLQIFIATLFKVLDTGAEDLNEDSKDKLGRQLLSWLSSIQQHKKNNEQHQMRHQSATDSDK